MAGAVLLALLAVLLLSGIQDRWPEPESAGAEAELSADAYRSTALGADSEALRERFLPVEPVAGAGADDEPPAPEGADRCVYYEAGQDALYRFCFTDDRLVDKAVVQRQPR